MLVCIPAELGGGQPEDIFDGGLGGDTDLDGIPDLIDPDDDNDGIPDSQEPSPDSNAGNGMPGDALEDADDSTIDSEPLNDELRHLSIEKKSRSEGLCWSDDRQKCGR